MKDKLKKLTEKNNFYFYINQSGEPTLNKYDGGEINFEIYIEQRREPAMTAVFVEGLSDTHPLLNKALQHVIDIDDKFKVARLKLDNNPKINIEDFMAGNNPTDELPKYLYHGTSHKSATEILENGLLPREISNQESKYKLYQEKAKKTEFIFVHLEIWELLNLPHERLLLLIIHIL